MTWIWRFVWREILDRRAFGFGPRKKSAWLPELMVSSWPTGSSIIDGKSIGMISSSTLLGYQVTGQVLVLRWKWAFPTSVLTSICSISLASDSLVCSIFMVSVSVVSSGCSGHDRPWISTKSKKQRSARAHGVSNSALETFSLDRKLFMSAGFNTTPNRLKTVTSIVLLATRVPLPRFGTLKLSSWKIVFYIVIQRKLQIRDSEIRDEVSSTDALRLTDKV